jgi:hypothetical protein
MCEKGNKKILDESGRKKLEYENVDVIIVELHSNVPRSNYPICVKRLFLIENISICARRASSFLPLNLLQILMNVMAQHY